MSTPHLGPTRTPRNWKKADYPFSNDGTKIGKYRGEPHSDPGEKFHNRGQIIKLRRPQRRIETPEWVFSDKKVREFLLKLFPNLHDETRDRDGAALYAFVIYSFFRRHRTATDIEFELKLNPGRVSRIIQDIRLVSEDKRRDGRPRSLGKRGRPRKQASQKITN